MPPPRFTPIGRAKLALYGTIGLCTYTSFQTWAAANSVRMGIEGKDQKLIEKGLELTKSILDYRVCSRRNLEEGRYFTLVTSIWNHGGGLHFFGNMLGLWSFGRIIAYNFGARTFLAVFYGGGIVGNLVCLGLDRRYGEKKESQGKGVMEQWSGQRQQQQQQRREAGFLGASGGVCAILAANACLNPWGSMVVGIMFIPVPVPNFIGALGFAGFSVWAQVSDFQADVAHLGHLGGLVYGFLWFVARFKHFPIMI